MRCVVQKVKRSSVKVDGKIVSEIGKGLNVLVGFTSGDDEAKIDYMINKIINLRVFEDENDVMNKSVLDVNGEILLISQFTLYGDASKGNRPSYINALKSEDAEPLYELMIKKINDRIKTYPGVFGADMEVEIINDGPATILIEK
jgi:D-tyrosyl-tRNA(Tyr) deacylase